MLVNDVTNKRIPDPTDSQELMIEGAGCASCVGKIEASLKNVPGVRAAEMNFAQRTVTISGDVAEDALILAVEQAGYNAKSHKGSSDEELLDEKEQAGWVYYKQLMREMTVTSNMERMVWLLVGLATLGVMIFSGKHFYIGAWKSLLNHSANMGTLIALGTGTAWIYSMVVVFVPEFIPEMARHVYFEATAMIIGLINLGLALEIKARGRTSEAIKRLIGLQAKTDCQGDP